jgi:predicted transcriptional regulator
MGQFDVITDNWEWALEVAIDFHNDITHVAEKCNISYELALKILSEITKQSTMFDLYEMLEDISDRLKEISNGL